MKKKIILLVLAGLFFISSIPLFFDNNVGAALCGIVISLALGYYGLKSQETKAQPAEPMPSYLQKAAENPPTAQSTTSNFQLQHSTSPYEFIHFRVVGVTFKNGRKSRQTILRRMRFEDPPFDHCELEIRPYDYEGILSYGVFVNGEQVGNISKNDKDKISLRWNRYHDISSFDVIGGGTRDGKEMSYGLDITIRFIKE